MVAPVSWVYPTQALLHAGEPRRRWRGGAHRGSSRPPAAFGRRETPMRRSVNQAVGWRILPPTGRTAAGSWFPRSPCPPPAWPERSCRWRSPDWVRIRPPPPRHSDHGYRCGRLPLLPGSGRRTVLPALTVTRGPRLPPGRAPSAHRRAAPRSEATIRRLSGGGGPVRRLTNHVTPKLSSIPREPMPSGLIPNHQASGPLHSKTLNQPI